MYIHVHVQPGGLLSALHTSIFPFTVWFGMWYKNPLYFMLIKSVVVICGEIHYAGSVLRKQGLFDLNSDWSVDARPEVRLASGLITTVNSGKRQVDRRWTGWLGTGGGGAQWNKLSKVTKEGINLIRGGGGTVILVIINSKVTSKYLFIFRDEIVLRFLGSFSSLLWLPQICNKSLGGWGVVSCKTLCASLWWNRCRNC